METTEDQMKWLIVGAKGQFGRAMQAELTQGHVEFLALDRVQLDITNENQIIDVFDEAHPGVVLNAAALTNVDDAEGAESEARLVNAYGPSLLANACSIIDSKYVHLSTDYVFSGFSSIPFNETQGLDPQSAYGRTKA